MAPAGRHRTLRAILLAGAGGDRDLRVDSRRSRGFARIRRGSGSSPGGSRSRCRERRRRSIGIRSGSASRPPTAGRCCAGCPGKESPRRSCRPTPRSQFGSQGTPPPTLYAPFTFLVGNVTIDQFPSSQWNGNLQTVTEGGTEYGAVAVEKVRERSDGGRARDVDQRPERAEADRRRRCRARQGDDRGRRPHRPTRTGSPRSATRSRSPKDQAFRGFGGRHNSIDQARQRVLQLDPAGEPERGRDRRPRSAGRARSRPVPVPERRVGRLLRAVVVHLTRPLRLPARPRRAVALADGLRPRRTPGRSRARRAS